MRTVFPLLLLVFSSNFIFSQDDQTKQGSATNPHGQNELRLNVTNFIILNAFTADYERLLSDESSLGVSLLIGLGDTNDIDLIRNFELTPYYRQFFSKRYARGFFVEGFASVINREDTFFTSIDTVDSQSQTNVALGVSVGGKFLTRGGFVAEVFVGVGRTLFDNNDFFFDNVIGRGGISLGYRF